MVNAALAVAAGHGALGAVDIVAHRGASHDAPENTLASVRLAWERNADAVEIDVHLTGDGRIITIHDPSTRRTTGVDWPVEERSLAELRTLDAGAWKAPRWNGEPLRTLEEILATIPDGKRIFIEIKCGPEILPELKRALAASGKRPEQTAVISFGVDTVREAKRQLPGLKVYWLSGWKKDEETGKWLTKIEDLVAIGRDTKVDGLDLAASGPLDEEAVRRIRDAGLEFHVWTVDDPDLARRMIALGVDSITTNRPAWLRDHIADADPK